MSSSIRSSILVRGYLALALTGIGAIGIVATGCDTGEYNRRYNESVGQSTVGPGARGGGTRRKGNGLLIEAPSDLTGSSLPEIKIHLPTVFQESVTGMDARDQPPFVELDGFQYVRVAKVTAEDETVYPLLCYVAYAPLSGKTSEDVRAGIESALSAKFEDVTSKTDTNTGPNGEQVNWKRIDARGDQPFDTSAGSKRLPGRFLIYLVSLPNHEVIVAWQAADAIAGEQKFFDAVELSMETMHGAGLPKDASAPADGS